MWLFVFSGKQKLQSASVILIFIVWKIMQWKWMLLTKTVSPSHTHSVEYLLFFTEERWEWITDDILLRELSISSIPYPETQFLIWYFSQFCIETQAIYTEALLYMGTSSTLCCFQCDWCSGLSLVGWSAVFSSYMLIQRWLNQERNAMCKHYSVVSEGKKNLKRLFIH